jgi:hypothetical protein
MNRDWVLFHLAEAADALRQAIEEISDTPDYGDPEFAVDMQHIYHHINTAWNSRNSDPSDVEPGSDALFTAWSQLPVDLEMMAL